MGCRERQNDNPKGLVLATVQGNGRVSVGWESTKAEGTQGDRNEEDSKVSTLGNLTVFPHEAGMNILVIGKDRLGGNQILDARENLTTMVKDRVGDGGSVNRKEYAVDEGVTGREVSWRISLVTRLIERGVFIHNLQHLVTVTSVVPNVVIVDRDVSRVPRVCIPNREDNRGR